MKRYGNLFESVVDFQNLAVSFKQASRGKKQKVYIIEFFLDLEENLLQIQSELEREEYMWGGYYIFEVQDSKKRLISAPVFRDRVVHHALCNIIDPIFDRTFIAHSFACRKGKGTLAGVKAYERFINSNRKLTYVLKCDIQKYFPSIDHDILFRLVEKKIKDQKLLNLLRTLIFTGAGIGIPIGNLTSQLFANIYLDRLDHYLKEDCGINHYLRYMDDFLILHENKNSLREIREKIKIFLKEELSLTLHPKKQHIIKIDSGLNWLGYRVFRDGYKRVRTVNVVRFRRRLKKLEDDYQKGRISQGEVYSSLASWVGLSKHANAYNLSKNIFAERNICNLGKYSLCKMAV